MMQVADDTATSSVSNIDISNAFQVKHQHVQAVETHFSPGTRLSSS